MRRLLLLLAVVVLALLPGVARAHATVVASNPEPGQRLAAAPGLVALTFTESLNTRLSRAAVTAPDGRRFEGAASGEREIQVRLATDASGVYAVEWTTVSIVDGHTLRGGFRFGVGVAPDPGAEDEPATAPGPAELLLAVARALEYVALLAAAGMLLHRRLAAGDPLLAWVRPRPRWALALALASGCAVVVGEALIAAPAPSLTSLADYFGGGLPGAARLTRLAAEALALGLALVAPAVAALPLAVALVALAAAGHAAAVAPAWLGIAVDGVHLLAAGLWAGGILALATLRPPGGWRDTAARRLLGRFTPVALVAFPVTVAAGVVRAVQELGDLGNLVSTSYGLVLNLKVWLVLAMVPLSLLAWRRRWVAPRLEPALAVAVLGAAALLAAFPLPPGRLSEADEARARAVPEGALPRPGDLTLGGSVGDLVVGITLRPGGPGPNEALVHLVPLDGEDAAVGVPVELTVGPRSFATRACGPACRVTELELRGGERIEVRVAGGAAGGGTVAFDLPDLPAADGAALLARAQRRMHALRAYRVRETLGPASPPSRGTYTFQAPDRLHLLASTGELVWIGQTQYRRDGPAGDWVVGRVGSAPEVPRFAWDGSGPPGAQEHVAPRLLGSARLGDVDTTVLAFFAELGRLPVWFRLWVDAEGLVRRAEMRARGHVMDQEYGDFDAPLAVEPPIAAAAADGAPAVGGPPTPLPGTPSAGAAAAAPAATGGAPAAAPLPRSALPQPGDLTLGGGAGEVLVGLTLRPGAPGKNTLLLYLLRSGGEAAGPPPARLRVGGRSIELRPCQTSRQGTAPCRAAEVELRGGERLEVGVPDGGGTKGGTAAFDLPALPTPDGAGLVERVRARMQRLRAYRVEEWLGPTGPGAVRVHSALAYRAPDRMRLETDNGFQRVWVGDTRYSRDGPDQDWRVEGVGPTLRVPRFDWDATVGEVVAPRLLGAETVDGVVTQVVSFFVQLGRSPVWFRLWVDADGLVRQAQMHAEAAHFMDQRYRDFDAPLAVERPSG